VLSAVPTAVLDSATFRTLSETKMSASVAAAMDYITKRGCEMFSLMSSLLLIVSNKRLSFCREIRAMLCVS